MTHAAFIRFKPLVGGGIILKAARHNTRELQNENGANGHIDSCRSALNVCLRGEAAARAIDHAAKHMLAGAGITKQRKGGVQAIEVVFSLPVATSIDVYAYFEDCTRWAGGRFGENNVISSVIHLDEAAPHCHVLIVPLRDGRMAGSDMLGRRKQFLEMLDEFYERVASVYGLPKAPLRLTKSARCALADAVLERLKTTSDGAMSSAAWQSIREAIENDPTPFAANLGIEIVGKPQRAKSVVEIFTGTGRRTSEDKKTYRELSANETHSLSCVGHSISRPAPLSLLARAKPSRDDANFVESVRIRDSDLDPARFDAITGDFTPPPARRSSVRANALQIIQAQLAGKARGSTSQATSNNQPSTR
jgi:hypothetical protein